MLGWQFFPNFQIQSLYYESVILQGDPNQNFLLQMAITLKICMQFWPHVGKSKMWFGCLHFIFENCKQTAENYKQTAEK